jgi:ankyrin repeat protein
MGRDAAAVQALLDKGANVNVKDLNGTTALMTASWRGHLEVVQVLPARGPGSMLGLTITTLLCLGAES